MVSEEILKVGKEVWVVTVSESVHARKLVYSEVRGLVLNWDKDSVVCLLDPHTGWPKLHH